MRVRDAKRAEAVERMADHLLEHGLAAATLRPLAAAAGVSDRMLLYYFGSKEDVMAATLTRVAGRLTAELDTAIPPGPRLKRGKLLRRLWSLVASPGMSGYMRVWLELAAAAASGAEPHRGIAGGIAAGFLDWIEARIDADKAERHGMSARLLATLEGALLLDALGRRDLAEAAVGALTDA